jgi:hypothetical protein
MRCAVSGLEHPFMQASELRSHGPRFENCLIGESIGLKTSWIDCLMKRTRGSPLFQEWVLRETGTVPQIGIEGTHERVREVYSLQKRDPYMTESGIRVEYRVYATRGTENAILV